MYRAKSSFWGTLGGYPEASYPLASQEQMLRRVAGTGRKEGGGGGMVSSVVFKTAQPG